MSSNEQPGWPVELPLPTYKHLPGRNSRPRHLAEVIDSVVSNACDVTSSVSASTNVAWLYGIRLINAGFFWECHEVLEVVWGNAAPNSRERFLVQGIIHVANARLKLALDQPRAAQRLAVNAAQCMRRAFPNRAGQLMGLCAEAMETLSSGCDEQDYAVYLQLRL